MRELPRPDARVVIVALATLLAIGCGAPVGDADAGPRADGGPGMVDAAVDAALLDDAATLDAARSDAHLEGDAGGAPLTRIRIVYPAGTAITIRGSGGPLAWDVGVATTAAGDVHELTTREITEPIEWKPLLGDATWSVGPNYHVAPGETIEVAPRFSPGDGRVVELAPLTSAALGNTRPVWAYLPPSYDENTAAALPVVYMHDGQNLFDPALAFGGAEWEVDETLDRASREGVCPDGSACQDDAACGAASRCDTFREAIVVGIGNTARRIYEYTPTSDPAYGESGGADVYLDAITLDLKPSIDAMLRTRPGREHTAIVGSSLGGLVSSYAGVTRAETFGLVGAMSPSTWWDERSILVTVATIPSRPLRALRVYVDSGDSGTSMDGVADTRMLADAYEAAGYVRGDDLEHLVAPGHEHREAFWRARLPGALAFLLGPRERLVP
jgi:predicted alpha/beta superfamily hydrolase